MEEKKKESFPELNSTNESVAQEHSEMHCLNCGALLTGKYCNECGQKEQELHEPFWHLIAHFAGDIFHFDSKFFRTFVPLLFRPGFLTNEHVSGKRVNYMKPVQLYFFVSVIFFLIYFSFFNDQLLKSAGINDNPAAHISDSTLSNDSSLIKRLNQMKPAAANHIVDSLNMIYAQNIIDSTVTKKGNGSPKILVNQESDGNIQLCWTAEKNLPATVEAYQDSINKLPKDQRPNFIKRAIEVKAIEINKRRNEEGTASIFEALTENFMHNVPKLMFLMLPFFALILKLLYVRRKVFLIDHAIFTLHFHTFIFLFLALLLIVNLLTGFSIGTGWIFLILTIYFVIALKKVYKQSWVKSMLKAVSTYFLYAVVMVFVVVIGLVISAASL